jgi:hypothetical protein
MNLSNTILLFVLSLQYVDAYDILQILLNNGNDFYCIDRLNNCCSTTEWDIISTAVYTMAKNQRHTRSLRGTNETSYDDKLKMKGNGNDSTHTNSSIDVSRELTVNPVSCANNCRGYATGRCMALNCIGYRQRRRSMIESFTSIITRRQHDRDLFWATGCDNQKVRLITYLPISNPKSVHVVRHY